MRQGKIALLLAGVVSLCFGAKGKMLSLGDNAPEFTAVTDNGDTVSLASFREKKNVVLIFYPGNETPVCTKQLCEIRDDYTRFKEKNAVVFGINPAERKSHERFTRKYNFSFPLLVDKDRRIAKAYRAKGKLFTIRMVYVIDLQGKIVYAKRGKPPVSEILTVLPDAVKLQPHFEVPK